MASLLRVRFLATLVVAQLVTVWVIFILNWSQPDPVYATCTGHYWAGVQEPPAQDFIGTEGNNQAQNAAVSGGTNNFFVNSIWIVKDENNLAEIGWIWRGGWSAPKQFVYTEDAGVGSVQEFSTLSVGTNYNFRTVKLSGTNTWGFYRDSNLITTKSLPNLSSGGDAGAMQERNEACNNPDLSEWWTLKRATTGGWSSWANMQLYMDNDPDYCVYKLSNVWFKTQRTGDPDCNLSN